MSGLAIREPLRLLIASTVAFALASPGVLAAQQVKDPVVGIIKSGTVHRTATPFAGTAIFANSEPITTVGSGQILLLTQTCMVFGGSNDQGLTLGDAGTDIFVRFARAVPNTPDRPAESRCVSFTPGIVVPQGADVRCSTSGSFTCTVIGVVTKKQ